MSDITETGQIYFNRATRDNGPVIKDKAVGLSVAHRRSGESGEHVDVVLSAHDEGEHERFVNIVIPAKSLPQLIEELQKLQITLNKRNSRR